MTMWPWVLKFQNNDADKGFIHLQLSCDIPVVYSEIFTEVHFNCVCRLLHGNVFFTH